MSDLTLQMAVWVEGLKAEVARIAREERGQGMVEYGLILALVAVAAVVVLIALGGNITSIFSNVGNQLTQANATPTH